LLEGKSLRSLLRTHRQERRYVDVRVAVSFASQILAGLDYAHRSVIHRDIKPENVMVLASERVKVLDFGLAKVVHEEVLRAATRPESQRGDGGHPGLCRAGTGEDATRWTCARTSMPWAC
jgi:serine/threonine protein kinase